MALDPLDLLKILDRQVSTQKRPLEKLAAYADGEQPLRFVTPALEDLVGGGCAHLILNWPGLVAEAYDERSDIVGFRMGGSSSADQPLWDVWQENDGDGKAPESHIESLISGSSYVIVGTAEDDGPPIFTVESGLQCAVRRDPRTRKVSEGAKFWRDEDEKVNWASLYLPGKTIAFRKGPRTRGWVEDRTDEYDIDQPLIVQLVNRGRIRQPDGRSEFYSILPLADAANKIATDMMIAAEHHALPRRWMLGMTEDDFTDEHGKPIPAWEAAIGKLWGSEKKPGEAEFGQFAESDLVNFHATIRLLAQLAGQLAGLPEDYMSFASDNPASADAMRAAEARFVKRCERKHTGWGGSWEDVQRLLLKVQDPGKKLPPEAMRMETLWRDPATPTKAQTADAVVKLATATVGGKPVLPLEMAREMLGFTPEQRKLMALEDEKVSDSVAALAAEFRQPTAPPAPAADPELVSGAAV